MQPINFTLDVPVKDSCDNCFCCFPSRKEKKHKEQTQEIFKECNEQIKKDQESAEKNMKKSKLTKR